MKNYECPRCFFKTNNISHMKHHLNRRFKCENVTNFSLNIEGDILFEYIKKNATETKKNNERRVITKKENEVFECKFCQKTFTARQNVYRHQKTCNMKINHIFVNNFHNNNKQDTGNNCQNTKNANVGININEMIQQQNNNCVVINTYINLNPFQKEDLSHIDKILMLDMLFNNEDNDGVFSKNIFQKIHAELIRLPQNLNMYLEGFHSKSVIVYTNRDGMNMSAIEKESTKNAIFLRVKSIYEKVKDIYTDIYLNYSHLFYEIYDRYKHKKAFDFSASDDCFKKKMFESLVNAIDYRFEQYKTQSNSQCLVKYRQNIQTSIRMDLVDTRDDTKEIMGVN